MNTDNTHWGQSVTGIVKEESKYTEYKNSSLTPFSLYC